MGFATQKYTDAWDHLPSRELLYFDQVVKTLIVRQSRLTNDPTYKQLRYISRPLFKELVDRRQKCRSSSKNFWM